MSKVALGKIIGKVGIFFLGIFLSFVHQKFYQAEPASFPHENLYILCLIATRSYMFLDSN